MALTGHPDLHSQSSYIYLLISPHPPLSHSPPNTFLYPPFNPDASNHFHSKEVAPSGPSRAHKSIPYSKNMARAVLVFLVAAALGASGAQAWEETEMFTPSRYLQESLTPEAVGDLYKKCALSLGTNPEVFYETSFGCCDVLTVDSVDTFLNITAGDTPGFRQLCASQGACRCRLQADITCKCGKQEVSGSALSLAIAFGVILGLTTVVCCFIDRRQVRAAQKIDKLVHDGYVANESMHELTKEASQVKQPSL